MKMLTNAEIKLLAEAIYMQQKEKGIHTRAGQTIREKDMHRLFSISYEGRKLMKQIPISDNWYHVYSEIERTGIKPEETKSEEIKDIRTILECLPEPEQEEKVRVEKIAKVKDSTYLNYFRALREYDTEPLELSILTYTNGEKRIKVNFLTSNVYHWYVELPFVNKKGFFEMNGNKFMFMYTPKNLKRFLEKIDDTLRLYHPFEKLVQQMITAYTSSEGEQIKLKKEYFTKAVSKCQGRKCSTLQRKIDQFISHSKEFYWEKDSTSPIVWFDKEVGQVGEYCFTNNILLDMSYDDIIKYGLVEGVDLLTGSTSTPAKRVSLATNYEIVKDAEGTCCVTKVRDKGELSNYLSETKTVYPFFARTSGKRNNSATVKDTQNLIKPLSMINRVYIK